MKILFYIPIFVAYNLVAQQPKKLTEKFFPDFDIEISTPAFQKKKGFTKYPEMMDFLNDFIKKSHGLCQMEFIGTSQNGFKIPSSSPSGQLHQISILQLFHQVF